ncbi:unnamed protein product [Cunninghamella blakesleeana]
MAAQYKHPYYPTKLELPNYQPNKYSMVSLLSIVGTIFSFILLFTIIIVKKYQPNRQKRIIPFSTILFNFSWFIICGILHCGFEAYWIYYRHQVVSRSDILAELWKEYAKGDSRYMSCDPLLLTLETITVFIWGPLCFKAAYDWFYNRPQYHLYQLIVSVGHLFSCSLYFIMDTYEGFLNCDPHPIYFWIYFVGFNSPWIILPLYSIIRNGRFITNNLTMDKLIHINNKNK